MNVKKFILFIVEGNNDKKEIDAILHTPYFDKYREKYRTEFLVVNNDITTSPKLKKMKIRGLITDLFQRWRAGGVPYHNIKTHDVQEIIHIVDLDGAFIPNSGIIESDTGKWRYNDTTIEVDIVPDAIHRNRVKSDSLNALINTSEIDNVPYSIYFMSCNMDHVLFNIRNSYREEKSNNAQIFQRDCMGSHKILTNSIFCEGIKTENSYIGSWDEIQKGYSSLSRKTNFNLFFDNKAKNLK